MELYQARITLIFFRNLIRAKLQIFYCFRAEKFLSARELLQETEVRAALRQLSRFEYAIEYAYLVVHANNRFCFCRNIVTVIIVTIIIVTAEILSVSRNYVILTCLSSFFFLPPPPSSLFSLSPNAINSRILHLLFSSWFTLILTAIVFQYDILYII